MEHPKRPVDTDNAGNIQPSKAKSTERIDGVYALVMALDAMHRDRAAPERSLKSMSPETPP